METAWRNQLMQSCKAAFPDMYPEQTDPPPVKTKQQLEASRRAHLAKIQEAKEKHAREEQQSAAAARQLQAEEELNQQRRATIRSLIDAANIAAGVYSVLPKAPPSAKKPPPPAKTYSTPSNRLTPGTMPQQSTTPTSPSRSTCDQPGCAIREVE
jgi:DNA-binding protein H-NS